MARIEIKVVLFVAAIFLPACAFAERVSVDGGEGFARFEQKDFVMSVKDSSYIEYISSKLSGRHNGEYASIGQVVLENPPGSPWCKKIKKSEGENFESLLIYLQRSKSSTAKDWDMFIQYPENYFCKPTKQEAQAALDKKIKVVKDDIAFLNSDEAKENSRLFLQEQRASAEKKVEFGGYIATRKNLLGSVVLACYTGSLDSNGMLYVSKEEQADRYKALLGLYEGEPASAKRITNAFNFARRNLSDRYPLDTMGQYRASVCDQMVTKGKL